MRTSLGLCAALTLISALAFHAAPISAGPKSFLYVHDNDEADNEVHAFQVGTDGSLNELPGSPFDTGSGGSGGGGMCQTLSFSQKGRFLFASSAQGIVVFNAAKDGTLTLVPGSPFGGGEVDGLTAVRRGNKTFVYASNYSNDLLLAFSVNANGSLTPIPGSPFPSVDGPAGMSTGNNKLFVANEGDDSVSAYRINSNGSLSAAPGSPFSVAPGGLYNVNASPDGRFVYAADASSSNVFAFNVNPATADLTPVPGSPFAAAPIQTDAGLAIGKGDLLIAPGGENLEPNLQVFRYQKRTGVLSPLGQAQSAGTPSSLDGAVIDPKGRFVVVSASNDDVLRVFSVNRSTGALTSTHTQEVELVDKDVNGLVLVK